jgi:hypothetical protein
MKTVELQDSIIQKVRGTDDEELLNYVNQLLNNSVEQKTYQLSDFEKTLIAESKADYLLGKTISNEDVFNQNEKWLAE